jgi:general secretion pathway protein I
MRDKSENRQSNRGFQIQRGFTLLEILAALAIVAIGIAAVTRTVQSSARTAIEAEQRTVAGWVAANQLAELRLSRQWPAARQSDHRAAMAGRTWHVRRKVVATSDPELLRVDIEVYGDEKRGAILASLFGYLARATAASGKPG